MNNETTNQLLCYFQSILDDYASSCGVEPFDGQIIIAEDMAKTYLSVRCCDASDCDVNLSDIQKYHGLTVQPISNDGLFTIILNKDYIVDCINKNNIDWVGTLVHEATHVNDFKDYFKLVLPKSYDELYKYSLHRVFLHWTEFHARAIGHYFLRKYSLDDFKSTVHIDHIVNTEMPFHIQNLVEKLNSTNDADSQLYVVTHFLGRLAVWQYLYPHIFDSTFIKKLTNNNPWMEELYYFLIKYNTLEEIQPHFQEFEAILDKHFV